IDMHESRQPIFGVLSGGSVGRSSASGTRRLRPVARRQSIGSDHRNGATTLVRVTSRHSDSGLSQRGGTQGVTPRALLAAAAIGVFWLGDDSKMTGNEGGNATTRSRHCLTG